MLIDTDSFVTQRIAERRNLVVYRIPDSALIIIDMT